MKSRIALAFVTVALLIAPSGVDAQFGGLLKKKAGEMLKGKPAEPAPTETKSEPAPSPTPAPTSEAGTSPPASPARAADTRSAPADPDPLDVSALRLQDTANRLLREEVPVPESGDWRQLPYIDRRTVAAAMALDETARTAFVEQVGAAAKALVMSDTFARAHAEYIAGQFRAVDHGLKGLASPEDMMKKKDFAGFEAATEREMALNIVESVEEQSPADIQRTLGFELESWRKSAATATGKSAAKYQRYVQDGEALVKLGTSDPQKLRRGYAVLRSIDTGGPDTEEALYATYERAKTEKEQLAWDAHNLKGVLKRQLTAVAAIVPTVDFAAETAEKNGLKRFVKPAYEAKGAVWKACFRAGKGPSTAALRMAQAWLKEL